MKILLFSDVHLGTTTESTTNPGTVRLASSQAVTTLEKCISKWNTQEYDYIIQMGDILREVADNDANILHISQAAQTFSSIKHPLIHILGNHDIRAASKEKISNIFQLHNLSTNFFGQLHVNSLQIVWLDSELDENKRGYISEDELQRLRSLDKSTLKIVFSHHTIVPQNSESNFYFNNTATDMYYTNHEEVVSILKTKNVIACINAHCHWFSYKKVAGIHFITNPAFSENIAGIQYPENNPGIYSILEVSDGKLLFKSYSDKFAFVNLELEF